MSLENVVSYSCEALPPLLSVTQCVDLSANARKRAANQRARAARKWLHRSCVTGGTLVHRHERPHAVHVCATAAATAARWLAARVCAAAATEARAPPAILPTALGPRAKIAFSSEAIVSKAADPDTAVDIDAIADAMSRASTNR